MNMNVWNPEYDQQLDDILELDNNELQGWPVVIPSLCTNIIFGAHQISTNV